MSGPHVPLGPGREFDAVRTMLDEWGALAVGIGDDAAVLDLPSGERLVASTDASVEGVHFRRGWMSAAEIAERATTAALSDLAAMAATPRGLLLALSLPASWQEQIRELARGIGAAATRTSCPIVGGNVTSGTELSLTITVLGSAAAPLRRSGARAGDRLYVTGRLGGPGAVVRALTAGRAPASAHRERFVAPAARIREARWLAERGARAAIDISDGLLADAAHLARASGVSIDIARGDVPRMDGVSAAQALSSGEEYELLVAMPAHTPLDVDEFTRAFGVPLTGIGRVVTAGAEPVTVDGSAPPARTGHDHLAAPR